MKISVVGSGAWGTALAICLCGNGHEVVLWSHNPQKADELSRTRINPSLDGVTLPEMLEISADPAYIQVIDFFPLHNLSPFIFPAVQNVSGSLLLFLFYQTF